MDFNLTREQIDIQKAAKEFAEGEFDPDAALEYDEKQQFPSAIWKKAAELGFVGVHFPEEYGGQDLGLFENVLIIEAFCRQDSGIGIALALSDFGSEMILRYANDDQKKMILPVVARGEGIVTLAFLEQGYSIAPFETTAKKNTNSYILNGKKSFVTLAGLAQYITVVCQTNLDDPFGQSVVLADTQVDGIDVLSMGEKMGMRTIPIAEVSFSNASIPQEKLIGKEDKGYFQLRDFCNEARIEAGAMGIGIAQGGLDRAIEYSKKREQFGRAIVTFDVIRNKLADMYAEVELARLVAYKAAWSFDNANPDIRSSLLNLL